MDDLPNLICIDTFYIVFLNDKDLSLFIGPKEMIIKQCTIVPNIPFDVNRPIEFKQTIIAKLDDNRNFISFSVERNNLSMEILRGHFMFYYSIIKQKLLKNVVNFLCIDKVDWNYDNNGFIIYTIIYYYKQLDDMDDMIGERRLYHQRFYDNNLILYTNSGTEIKRNEFIVNNIFKK